MLLGHIDLVDRHMVRGWAVDTDRPRETVEAAVFVDGRLVGLVCADQARDDFRDAAKLGSGLHGLLHFFDPPLADDRDHDVVIRFGEGGKLLGQWRVTRELEPAMPPAVAPVTAMSALEAGADAATAISEGGVLAGFLDLCTRDSVAGWVARKDRPDEALDISILVDGRAVAQIRCDLPRKDLAEAGIYGDGAHGFSHSFEPPLSAAEEHNVAIRLVADGALLGQSRLASDTEVAGSSQSDDVSKLLYSGADGWARALEFRSETLVGSISPPDRHQINGWAADMERPNEPVELVILVDGVEVGRPLADQLRKDMSSRPEFGDGRHGLAFRFREALSAERDHEIEIKFANHGKNLSRWWLESGKDVAVTAEARWPGATLSKPCGVASEASGSGPRFIIHVGPHKTGTTYLQAGFFSHYSLLRDQGILYPKRWIAGADFSHRALADRLRSCDDNELEHDFHDLRESGHKWILISSEDLVDLKPPAVTYLKSLLGDSPVEIVFYCRRWSELIPSGWQEIVKHGSIISLPAFLAAHISNPIGSNVINYHQALDKFARVFTKASLRLVSYNNLVNHDIDLLSHFLRTFVDFGMSVQSGNTRPNASLDLFDTELIRALNVIEGMRGKQRNAEIRQRYLQTKKRLDLSTVMSAMKQDVSVVVVNEDRAGLGTVHELLFREYGDRLVLPRPDHGLFRAQSREIRFVQGNYVLADGVTEALYDIYAQLRQ
jgi:hypothetical protein